MNFGDALNPPIDAMKSLGDAAVKVVENSIRVLPTSYNGITYRSRTEARWAIFFDALEVKFQYEPEGFDLGGVWYLPDFFIPPWDIYIEVKPSTGVLLDIERIKASRCADHTGKIILVVFGDPRNDIGKVFWPARNFEPDDHHAAIRTCRECDATIIWHQIGGKHLGDPNGISGWGPIPLSPCENDAKCGDKFCDGTVSEKIRFSRNAASNFKFDGKRPVNGVGGR